MPISHNGRVALAYAEAKLLVFPCKADREPHKPSHRLPFGKATKRPLVAWASEASCDEAKIRQWWSKWPEALVAVPCKPNKIFLLDADRHTATENGVEGFAALCEGQEEPMASHPVTLTDYDGEHHLFRMPDDPIPTCAIGPGIETRGFRIDNDGGYFIAAGSQMPDGRGWRRMTGTPSLARDPLPLPPQWLIDLCTPQAKPREAFATTKSTKAEEAYALKTLDRVASELANKGPNTGRDNLLMSVATTMGRQIACGWIGAATVEGRLFDACKANGLSDELKEAELRDKIQRGIEAGMRNPHPPLPDRPKTNGATRPTEQQSEQEQPGEAPPAGIDVFDAGDDTELPPPRGWLLANQFCRKFLSSLVAPGAAGKTALRIAQLLSLASGRDLTGQHVFVRCRVLLLSFEDGRDELRRRVAAACIHHRVEYSELKGWLYYATPKGIKLAELDNGARKRGELEQHLRNKIAELNPDIVCLDPFVKTHGLEENDNSAMDFVCDLLATLADEFNIAVDAPHHSRKGAAVPGDADMGRGSSSIRDAGRLIYTLTPMNQDEAEQFGISQADRRDYIRLDSAKVNIVRPARTATWFKLTSVAIGNATPDYPAGDQVQTVEPWTAPDTWAGLDNATLNLILNKIETGMPDGNRYSDARNVKERAAWKVVMEHAPNKTETQAREMIKTWLKNGVLESYSYKNPVNSKEVSGLRVNNARRPGSAT
jgi:hypothetical protein